MDGEHVSAAMRGYADRHDREPMDTEPDLLSYCSSSGECVAKSDSPGFAGRERLLARGAGDAGGRGTGRSPGTEGRLNGRFSASQAAQAASSAPQGAKRQELPTLYMPVPQTRHLAFSDGFPSFISMRSANISRFARHFTQYMVASPIAR